MLFTLCQSFDVSSLLNQIPEGELEEFVPLVTEALQAQGIPDVPEGDLDQILAQYGPLLEGEELQGILASHGIQLPSGENQEAESMDESTVPLEALLEDPLVEEEAAETEYIEPNEDGSLEEDEAFSGAALLAVTAVYGAITMQ